MAKDNQSIILINKRIPQDVLPPAIQFTNKYTLSLDLGNYKHVHSILEQHNNDINLLEIYDITYCSQLLHGAIMPVSDHINRIGHNPLIGKQKTFGIDFIDIANLYHPYNNGVVTNSCGAGFMRIVSNSLSHKTLRTPANMVPPPFNNELSYPSTFLANVAILGHVYKYIIKAYLINIIQ